MNQLQDKWIGLDEAAEYLGIKSVTLRKWIKMVKMYRVIKLVDYGSLNAQN